MPPVSIWDLLTNACAQGGLTLTQARAMTEAQLREIYVTPDRSGGRFTIALSGEDLDQAFRGGRKMTLPSEPVSTGAPSGPVTSSDSDSTPNGET